MTSIFSIFGKPKPRGRIPGPAAVTGDDKRLEAFYRTVVGVIAERDPECNHDIGDDCLNRSCDWCKPRYSWERLRELVTEFWNAGGDVGKAWKRSAQYTGVGLTSAELHHLLLGVFVGGDRPKQPKDPLEVNPWLPL